MIGDCVTRILGTFGDVNPIDHSGGYIYARKDRPSDSEESATAELEYIEPPLGNGPRGTWDCPTCEGSGTGSCESPPYAYPTTEHAAIRCDCETCDGFGEWVCVTCKGTGEDPSLRWMVYTALVEDCDWTDWEAIASYTGQPVDTYRDAFTSGNILAMAHAIVDVASYHGWHEFDQYPSQLTRAEVEARCATFDAIEAAGDAADRRTAIGTALACAGYAATFTGLHSSRAEAELAWIETGEFLAVNPAVDVATLMAARAEAREAVATETAVRLTREAATLQQSRKDR